MRFFFHVVHLDEQIDDPEGRELDDLKTAKEEAHAALNELIAAAVTQGRKWTLKAVRICSADQQELAVVRIDPLIDRMMAELRRNVIES